MFFIFYFLRVGDQDAVRPVVSFSEYGRAHSANDGDCGHGYVARATALGGALRGGSPKVFCHLISYWSFSRNVAPVGLSRGTWRQNTRGRVGGIAAHQAFTDS